MRFLRALFGVLLVLLFATSAFADDDHRRVSKKQKYSDKGAKCKSVRSGNAALCGRAMLGSDGVTLLELNTNDQNGRPAGTILRVDVKLKHGGKQRFDNVNAATFSVSLNGLEWNDEINVGAKVRGLDGKTKEINVKVPVLNRPNLAVVSVEAPAEGRTEVPVIVTAMIENHGEFGANADCVLSVDGAQVDSVPQIWVDVGGEQVGCQLTHTFASGGTKTLQVSLNNVTPGDFDPSDNSATTQINIVAYLGFNRYTAFAQERETTREFLDGSRPKDKTVRITTSLNGTAGPLDFASTRVTADEYTGAAHISSTFNLELQPNGCLRAAAVDQPRFISICRAPTGDSDFSLSRMASVTYQSTGVDPAGQETYIIIASQGRYDRFGSTYEFRVALSDPSTVYEANAIISLLETNITWVAGGIRFSERLLRGTLAGP